MAKVVIIDTGKSRKYTAATYDYSIATITDEKHQSSVKSIDFDTKTQTIDYPATSVDTIGGSAKLSSILPFYIKLTNIGIPGYGPGNVPPIGIAIVGFNNYIL